MIDGYSLARWVAGRLTIYLLVAFGGGALFVAIVWASLAAGVWLAR